MTAAESVRTIGGRFVTDPNWPPYKGEMSEVVRAVDLRGNMVPVAIKIFNEDAFQPTLVMETFARECESLQKLSSHDNIVTLVDIGRDIQSGCSYIALEWCGVNLLQQIRRYPEPTWDGFFARYGKDVLEALRFAYSQDVLHRDVKPQNVLINEGGQACVTDFGISKFRRYYRPGVTLAHFKSTPYAPPEDSLDFPDTRDVFSYAVLCLECIGGIDFETYDNVYDALETTDLPPEIGGILSRALARDPADRPSNIIMLAEEIESAMSRRAALNAVTRDVPVHLANSALEAMKAEWNLETLNKAAAQILLDLNETHAIDEIDDVREGGSRQFAILTAEFRFRAVIDAEKHALAIIGLSRQSPSLLERQREQAWQPLIRFYTSPVKGDLDAIDWFESEFDEFLTERKIQKSRRAETELFDQWASILRFKEGIQGRAETIYFHHRIVDGSRLRLHSAGNFGDDIIGQRRLINLSPHSAVTGEVERTDGEEIVLYCGGGQNLHAVPAQGELELDKRLSQMALRRQFSALDAVKFGRSVRPNLSALLTGKSPPLKPEKPEVKFFQEDLDDDKKAAVSAALGTSDLLVVEGPPGTGKTKFITELVAQILATSPASRILISSQTHVALDHALVNIERLAKAKNIPLRAVRIARANDDRVSSELDHLVLERCVRTWLQEANARSEKFLIDWAHERQISPENVRIGMALADLRKARIRDEDVQLRLRLAKRDMDVLAEEQKVLRKDKIKGDEYRAMVAEIRLKQAEIDELEEAMPLAKAGLDDAQARARKFPDLDGQIDGLSTKDLADLEDAFVNHATDGSVFRKLLGLAEEWRQRFGQSSDFHGAYVSDCDLIGGTCLGVATHALQSVEFDVCIIDEASKAAPTEMLVPMVKSKKWIIVGDPNQLPPFVDDSHDARSELAKNDLTKEDLKRTLLDHFIQIMPEENQVSLLTQHRMVKPIGDLVSDCFYTGKLRNVNEATCPWLAKAVALPRPVTWLNTTLIDHRHEARQRGTFVNSAEVEAIGNLLLRLQLAASKRGKAYTVALLSGYGGQVAALDRLAATKQRQVPDLKIEVGTVDSYQGREADITVYSVTRSNSQGQIGFLREYERLNVALSRAKLGLVIVGDLMFCDGVAGQNPFADVIAYMRGHPTDCAFVDVQP